jgi:hypothetical protein
MENKLRKVIVVCDLIDKAITNICNAALKFEGLPMIASVNAIKDAIKEESWNDRSKGGDLK